MYGGWFMNFHRTVQWLWFGLEGQSQKDSVHGNAELKEARDCSTFESRSTSMCNGEHAKTFVMSALWNRLEGSDREVKGALSLAKFCNKIGGYKDDAYMFSRLQDISYLKVTLWNFGFFS